MKSLQNILIEDCETYTELFLNIYYDPEERRWYRFEVSKWKNELEGMMKFIDGHLDYYVVTFNGLSFDSQVIEWIVKNYENWNELSGLEITAKIAQFASDRIDDANYDIFPPYKEDQLIMKQIDLFKVHHYDNKNRRISLKRLEYEMDMLNVSETPVPFDKIGLSLEDRKEVIEYCKNDILSTYAFYKITIGDTSHPIYKGNNRIQLRLDIQDEFGVYCLNYSDSKIGDELIKKYYCEEKNIKYEELPRKGTFRKSIPIRYCIAKYIEFKTPQLKKFFTAIKRESLGLKDEFNKTIEFYGTKYSFMKGGLHSVNKPKIFEETENTLIVDWDVSSYYPAIIINNGRYPAHLGKEFLTGYKKMYEKRLELKPLSKTDKKIKGIVDALKLAVNSVYGKSSDMQSWIYDRQLTMFTTITGELSLMMLIEAYELEGINVISANTDGVTIMINRSKLEKMFEINKWWTTITQYELERTDYKKIVFSSVNDYIAIKTNGEIKKKGDFTTDFDLSMNKSARIVPLALEKYFVNNVPVEDTILSHKNIYDFTLRQKASKNFHYEGITHEGKTVYNKLIRYYVSNTGEKLLKIKNPECTTNAAEIMQVHAGDWVATVCNTLHPSHSLGNINYNFYIEKAQRIINSIEHNGRKIVKKDTQQLTLF